jgi:hypothetical protein
MNAQKAFPLSLIAGMAVLFAWTLITGLKKGRLRFRSFESERDRDPEGFWILVGFHVLVIGILVACVIIGLMQCT